MKTKQLSIIITTCLLISMINVSTFATENDCMFDESEAGFEDMIETESMDAVGEETATQTSNAEIAEETNTVSNKTTNETPAEIHPNVEQHTKAEIAQYLNNHKIAHWSDKYLTYKIQPSMNAPYCIGQLSDESLNDALTVCNNVRYIAGIPSAKLDRPEEDNCIFPQAWAWLAYYNYLKDHPDKAAQFNNSTMNTQNQKYNSLTKTSNSQSDDADDDDCDGYIFCGPPKPDDMPEETWKYMMTNRPYCDWNSESVEDKSLMRYVKYTMAPWNLDPRYTYVGFGCCGRESAGCWSLDPNSTAEQTISVWPAQKMPLEYYEPSSSPCPTGDSKGLYSAWTCLITDTKEDSSKIKITMTRDKDNETWHINSTNPDDNDNGDWIFLSEHNAHNGTYIQWFVHKFPTMYDGDIIHVKIEGTSKGTITYDVEFFSVDKMNNVTADSLTLLEKNKILKPELKKTKADKKSYKAKSSNKKVATISSKGIITAKKPGTATITVTKADTTIEYEVTVLQKPSLSFTQPLTKTGQTMSISENCIVSADGTTITPVKYTSAKPSVATIDANTGVITAGEKDGKTKITAYYAIKGKDGALKTITTKGKLIVKHEQ